MSKTSRSFEVVAKFNDSKVVGGFKRMGRAAGAATSVASRGFRAAAAGAGLLIAGMGAAVFGAWKLADASSDLWEAQTKANEVFTASVPIVNRFAETADMAFGMSNRAALDAASGFGLLLGNISSLDGSQIADMSLQLTALAGDLASFHNLSTDEAIAKLFSGMAGEVRPMRTIGIFNTSADAVVQNAVVMGLADSVKNVTEEMKLLSRFDLIFASTAAQKAAGDFERTSTGLANTTRKLQAAWENTKAALGEKIMPLMTRFLNMVIRNMPAIEAVGQVIVDVLAPAFDFAATAIMSFFNALFNHGDGLTQFSGIGYWAERAAIFIAGSLVPAVRSAAAAFMKHWPAIKKTVKEVFELLLSYGRIAVAWFRANWPEIYLIVEGIYIQLRDATVAFVEMAIAFWDRFGDSIKKIALAIWDGVVGAWDTATAVLTASFELFRALFEGDWDTLKVKVLEILGLLWEGLQETATIALGLLKDLFAEKFGEVTEGLRQWMLDLPGNLVDLGKILWTIGELLVQGLWDGAEAKMVLFMNWMITKINEMVGYMTPLGLLGFDVPQVPLLPAGGTTSGGVGHMTFLGPVDRILSKPPPGDATGVVEHVVYNINLPPSADPADITRAVEEAIRTGVGGPR